MVKMAKRPFEELIELLTLELDDRLQVVLRFGPDGTERLFARSDLASRSDDELARVFAETSLSPDEPGELVTRSAGGPNCLVGFLDDAVALLLARGTNETVAIAFDRTEEDALAAFVERCLAAI